MQSGRTRRKLTTDEIKWDREKRGTSSSSDRQPVPAARQAAGRKKEKVGLAMTGSDDKAIR